MFAQRNYSTNDWFFSHLGGMSFVSLNLNIQNSLVVDLTTFCHSSWQ